MDTLYIIIPAYNESENIKRTIEEWCPVVEKHNGGGASRLVIINDGSRDDTYEIASAECETHPLLTVLTKPNGGHGSTVLYGYRYALENGAEDVSTTDDVIEVTTTPADFATVLEAMQAAGFEQESADVQKIADQTVSLDKEKASKVMKIVERLEELDDVQQVSTNLDLPDDFEVED